MKTMISIAAAAALICSGCGDDGETTDTGGSTGDQDVVEATDEGGGEAKDEGGGDPKDEGTTTTGNTTGSEVVIAPPEDTKEEEDIAVVIEPPAHCRAAFDCVEFACAPTDDDCKAKCLVGADEATTAQINTLKECLDAKCVGDNEGQCALDKEVCYAEFYACWFNGKSGAEGEAIDCKDMEKCIEETCNGDDACITGCLEKGDPVAQRDFAILSFCIAEECGLEPTTQCQKLAEENICGTHYGHCLNF